MLVRTRLVHKTLLCFDVVLRFIPERKRELQTKRIRSTSAFDFTSRLNFAKRNQKRKGTYCSLRNETRFAKRIETAKSKQNKTKTKQAKNVTRVIVTDPHKILFFSLCIKSTIAVFKMPKQLSEENGGGPLCQQGN